MGQREEMRDHLVKVLNYYHPGRPGFIHPMDRADKVMPLWEYPEERTIDIVEWAYSPIKPPRYCGEPGVYQVESRAWLEWHWRRGLKLRRDPFSKARTRRHIPEGVRLAVYERDGFTCLHCGTGEALSLDHVYPHSLGGTDDMDNLQTLCRPCNSRKGVRVDANPQHQA